MTWDKALKVAAIAGGGVAGLFGGWDTLLIVLLAFMAIDYITGFLIGIAGKSPKTETGHLSSQVGWIGLYKKVAQLLAVVVAVLLDMLATEHMGLTAAVFRTAMMLYIIATEGLSILENLGMLGVKLPTFIIKALEQLQAENDKGGVKQDGNDTEAVRGED